MDTLRISSPSRECRPNHVASSCDSSGVVPVLNQRPLSKAVSCRTATYDVRSDQYPARANLHAYMYELECTGLSVFPSLLAVEASCWENLRMPSGNELPIKSLSASRGSSRMANILCCTSRLRVKVNVKRHNLPSNLLRRKQKPKFPIRRLYVKFA